MNIQLQSLMLGLVWGWNFPFACMQSVRPIFILVIVGLGFNNLGCQLGPDLGSSGQAKPIWVTRRPIEDSKYKYYVGVVEKTNSLSDAFEQARNNALYSLYFEDFGVIVEFESGRSRFHELDGSKAHTTVVDSFKGTLYCCDLKGFDNIGRQISKDLEGKYTVYALYRYQKSEIAQAKIKNRKVDISEDVLNLGRLPIAKRPILEINTLPEGADVLIDGSFLGRTPIKVIGLISDGKHKLRLDHSDYITTDMDFTVQAKKTTRISRSLLPATGEVVFHSIPEGANITVDGILMGQTPTKAIKLLASEVHTIQFTHPKTQTMTLSSYKLTKDPCREETILLRMR